MTLEQKAQYVVDAMTQAAQQVGLIFVDGPDPRPAGPPEVKSPSTTNYQKRCVFLTAVAEG